MELAFLKRSLVAFFLFPLGCGGVAAPHADEALESQGAALSCTLPDRPVTHGPSTSAPFALVQLSTATYPRALCNDGTAATYMIRRNPQSTKWLIWLEGGGNCYDSATCTARSATSGGRADPPRRWRVTCGISCRGRCRQC